MGQKGEAAQVTARHHQDIDDVLTTLVAELGVIEDTEGEVIGWVPRELASKAHISENTAQRWLRQKIVEGKVDCALGWRISPVTKRKHRVWVYWWKKDEDNASNTLSTK